MNRIKLTLVFCLCAAIVLPGCKGKDSQPLEPWEAEADRKVLAKYGKSLAELPVAKLVAISPHNIDIENEYETAFSLYHAVEYGQRVDIEWRDVGGGSSAILRHLRNVYENSDRSGMDIVWGGGEHNFQRMAAEGILQPMDISSDALENIPGSFGGVEMVDKQKRWCGSAVSGFGFLYNRRLLKRMNLEPPEKWEDLGEPRFFSLVGLADPTQSGSAAASYQMIMQSGKSWEDGWAKLLSILANAKKFYAGAGDAAEALPSGEVALSTCIDFYGITRAVKYPETIVYVSPKGQTSFNPDPIAILKNPPNPELAQRMVSFVLSQRGQALWALPVGHPDGPVRASLGRQPIREDVYEQYSGQLSPMIVNPYAMGQSMNLDKELWSTSFGLLTDLVWAAAVKNLSGMRAAKEKLIETGFAAELTAEFNKLPDNIARREQIEGIADLLRDKKQRDIIVTDWIAYFRNKYSSIAD